MVGITPLLMGGIALTALLPKGELPQFAIGMGMAWSFACFELMSRFEVAGFRPRRYLVFNLLRAVLLMGCTLGAAWLTHDALATALGNMLGLLLAILPLGRGRLAPHPRLFDRQFAREVVRFGLPFALSMLLAGLFTSGVRALVAALTDARELGLYTAAYAMSQNVLFVVAGAIGYTTYPLAVRAYETHDPAVLRAQLEDNLAFLLAIMVPAALGMALAAPETGRTSRRHRFPRRRGAADPLDGAHRAARLGPRHLSRHRLPARQAVCTARSAFPPWPRSSPCWERPRWSRPSG